MMKKFFLIVIGFMIIASVAYAAPVKVAVTVAPQKYFIERIGGDKVDVVLMVPPGGDPHTYEPKPGIMAELADAKLYFAIGIDFEKAWMNRFTASNSEMKVVHLENGLDKMALAREEGAGHEHGHDHGDSLDPHVWTSPANAKFMCQKISKELSAFDPNNAELYHQNYSVLEKNIDALDADLKKTLAGLSEDTSFLVFHPAWGYFARDYGLTQIAIENQGREPSPKELAKIITLAKEREIKVVFVQPQMSEQSAMVIAESIGGSVIKIDPLAFDWLSNLESVAKAFRAALR